MPFKSFTLGPFQTNSYLVYSEASQLAVVIDPAAADPSIPDFLEKNGLKLKYIFLTHSHLDHIGGVSALKAKYHPEIILHQNDVSLLESADEFARMLGLPPPKAFQPDMLLTDENEIKFSDLQFNVLHTPGHTPGSVSFVIDDLAFVGDTLFAQSIGRTDLPGGNYEKILTSIREKLFTLPDETRVFPGHGPDTSIQIEKVTNPFF